eukprot:819930-Amphidinium_carterae.1
MTTTLPGSKGQRGSSAEAFREEVKRRPLNVARCVHKNLEQALLAHPRGRHYGTRSIHACVHDSEYPVCGGYKTLAHLRLGQRGPTRAHEVSGCASVRCSGPV